MICDNDDEGSGTINWEGFVRGVKEDRAGLKALAEVCVLLIIKVE